MSAFGRRVRNEPVDRWIIGAAVIATAAVALITMKDPSDDAYIVFRYVARWLAGRGLTFNDGEFVEGFTSITWTVLLATVSRLTGASVPSTAIGLNFIILLVTVTVLDRAVHASGGGRAARGATAFLFSTAYAYFQVCFLGLELGLFSLLLSVFGALILAVSRRRDPSAVSTMWALGITGGVLFATRPEALLFVPATLAVMWLLFAFRGRELAPAAVGFAAVAGSVEAWRFAYYNDWLPNSSIAKSILLSDPHLRATIERRMIEGFTYLYSAYSAYPVMAVIVLVAVTLGGLRALRERSILLFVPIICGHIVVLENGGDWMPAYRLVMVYWPLYLLVGWSVAADLHAQYGRRPVVLLAALAAILHLSASIRSYREDPYIALRIDTKAGKPAVSWVSASRASGFADLYETAAAALGRVWMRGDILAPESIGLIGYLAPDTYVHDPNGLTNRALARDPEAEQGTFGRQNWRYTLSLKPAVILLHWWPHQAPWSTYGLGYPENVDRYCIRTPLPGIPSILYAIVRTDRPRYGEAIRNVGGRVLDVDTAGNANCPPDVRHARP